jgi:hypothetical protein
MAGEQNKTPRELLFPKVTLDGKVVGAKTTSTFHTAQEVPLTVPDYMVPTAKDTPKSRLPK